MTCCAARLRKCIRVEAGSTWPASFTGWVASASRCIRPEASPDSFCSRCWTGRRCPITAWRSRGRPVRASPSTKRPAGWITASCCPGRKCGPRNCKHCSAESLRSTHRRVTWWAAAASLPAYPLTFMGNWQKRRARAAVCLSWIRRDRGSLRRWPKVSTCSSPACVSCVN